MDHEIILSKLVFFTINNNLLHVPYVVCKSLRCTKEGRTDEGRNHKVPYLSSEQP